MVLASLRIASVQAEDLSDGNEQPTGDSSQLCTPTPSPLHDADGAYRLYNADGSVLAGDVNLDETVRSDDVALLLRYLVHLTELNETQLLAADANLNSAVNAQDAACILRYLVKIDTLPPSGVIVPIPPTPEPTPTPSPTPEPVLLGKVVILDPGHGLTEGGSWYGGSWTSTGYVEANTVFRIATYAKTRLEALGATVLMTRDSLRMVGNYTRMAKVHCYLLSVLSKQNMDPDIALDYMLMEDVMSTIVSEYDPSTGNNGDTARTYFNNPYDAARSIHPLTKRLFDYENCELLDHIVFISIHTNAPGVNADGTYATSLRGVQVFAVKNTTNMRYYTNYREEQNTRLGNCLLATMPYSCDLPIRCPDVQYNDYFMLREQNLTSVMIEAGYHTNEKDRAILSSAEGQDSVALGITRAVELYFTGTYH